MVHIIGSDTDNSSAFFDKKLKCNRPFCRAFTFDNSICQYNAGGANWENYVVAFTNTPLVRLIFRVCTCRADAWTWGANIPTKVR